MKNVVKGLRLTTGADILLEGVSDSCQKYNICINNSGEVNASALLSFFWESVAHAKNRAQKLEELLFMLDLKDSKGSKIPPTLIKLIVQEVAERGRF